MKNNVLNVCCALFAIALTAQSCVTDTTPTPVTPIAPVATTPELRCKINGVAWDGSASTTLGIVSRDSSLVLAGMNISAGGTVGITVPNRSFVLTPRSFAIYNSSSTQNFATYRAPGFTGNSYSTTTQPTQGVAVGMLNVSSVNATTKKANGTFSFTAVSVGSDTVRITEGIFNNVPYTQP
jgi:hypothetical protein